VIVFVSTHRHRFTHRAVPYLPGAPRTARRHYWQFIHSRSVASATYVLVDLDRLGPWELELAARLYRCLKAAGLRVLNDPALHLGRYALLRRLSENGTNNFTGWSPVLGEQPERFPVFLRTQSAHRGPLTGLLHDLQAAEAALAEALAEGYPLADLVFIEYAAAPAANGIFQKRAIFRIGDQLVPAPSVHSRDWAAKTGELGIAGEEMYAAERASLDDMPFTKTLMAAFEVAGVEYGRADFGVLNDAPQIYEINSNPMISRPSTHPNADRHETTRISDERYTAALTAIDSPAVGRRVPLNDPILMLQRQRDARRLWLRHWLP